MVDYAIVKNKNIQWPENINDVFISTETRV